MLHKIQKLVENPNTPVYCFICVIFCNLILRIMGEFVISTLLCGFLAMVALISAIINFIPGNSANKIPVAVSFFLILSFASDLQFLR